ncbi:MAG: hypothetical protein M1840_006590 [Geoglossum simile]|nr:MAG: hypothetical protein M1840_006590 [Geoglossum simile]
MIGGKLRRSGLSLRRRQTLSVVEAKGNTVSFVRVLDASPQLIGGGANTITGSIVPKPTITTTSDVAIQTPSTTTAPASNKRFDTPVSRFIIAAGTIGAFTFICAFLYVLWRIKTKRRLRSIRVQAGRRGTDASAGSQSNFEAYDYDAELKNAKLFDGESKSSEQVFAQRVSVPPAAFVRRSESRVEPQKWARQSIQSQQTFYLASNSSQDELDTDSRPTPTPLGHLKERSRLNKGHRKGSPSPLNLSRSRPKISSSSGVNSPPPVSPVSPVSPRTPWAKRTSTATSTESTPHFQTVDSWVNHQTARVDRKQTRKGSSKRDLEDPVPKVSEHYRQRREDNGGPVPETPSAFRYHPGRVVSWGGASLVPSEILDAKIGR